MEGTLDLATARRASRAARTVEGNGLIDAWPLNVCPRASNPQRPAAWHAHLGLCIDRNDVMDRIGKPRDLIGYLALTDEVRERAGQPPKSVWAHVFRARTVLYTVLWAGVGALLIVALFLRSPIDVSVTPVRNPTYVTLSDGSIPTPILRPAPTFRGHSRSPHRAVIGGWKSHRVLRF